MGEEGSVREVLQARGIIRHDVEVPWEVVGKVTVAMLALVAAGEVAEEGGGAVAGDRALVDTGDGRGVVRQVDERGVPGVMSRAHEVNLGQEAKLADDLFPAFAGDPLLATEFVEELGEFDLAVSREFDGLADGVDEPT